jgi:hypothetical protein
MNIEQAAESTIERVDTGKYWESRDLKGRTVGHALWMLRGIVDGYIQHKKAHRWLGYAQGILVSEGCVTLEAMKNVNKNAAQTRQK